MLSSERLAGLIHRYLSNIINENIKNPNIGYINLTEVRVTKDHAYATIFFTILNDNNDNIELAKSELGRFKGKIKKDLAEKIKDTRKIPDLIFKFDESLRNGNKIEKILATLNK